MPKRTGIYAQEPVAKASKIADRNPVGGSPQLGGLKSPTVPEKAGQLHGIGPQLKHFHHPSVRGSHSFGHTAELRQGHLRLSGVLGAHQIGKHSKLKPS